MLDPPLQVSGVCAQRTVTPFGSRELVSIATLRNGILRFLLKEIGDI